MIVLLGGEWMVSGQGTVSSFSQHIDVDISTNICLRRRQKDRKEMGGRGMGMETTS